MAFDTIDSFLYSIGLKSVNCENCSSRLEKDVKLLPIELYSKSQLHEAILCQLKPIYCFKCHANVCCLCGDTFEELDGDLDLGRDDDDDYSLYDNISKEQNSNANRMYHCTNTQAYQIYHLLIQLELTVKDVNRLMDERVQTNVIQSRNQNSPTNGIGFMSNRDMAGFKENNNNKMELDIVRSIGDAEICNILIQLVEYLPNPERAYNLIAADFVPHEYLNDLLSFSSIGHILKTMLKDISLQDIAEKFTLYESLFKFVIALTKSDQLTDFIYTPLISSSVLLTKETPEFGNDTIESLLKVLLKQSKIYTKASSLLAGTAKDMDDKEDLPREVPTSRPQFYSIQQCVKLLEKMTDIIQIDSDNQHNNISTLYDDNCTITNVIHDVELSLPQKSTVDHFESIFRSLSFGEISSETNLMDSYKFANNLTKMESNKLRMKAIAKEVSILSTGLPISYATSAIIRVAEERYDVIKLCITGPEGTPYANGLFFFDIFFPENYPLIPPVFEYLTTGNGAWRANPNLYQSGKVCLSLLNTWSTNQWLPSTSTLLQVILSIQAMIFVTRPYFNEPGYGDPTNSAECLSYNRDVRWNTVRHAMIGNLKNPPVGFEEVVKTFFELKKKRIIQQLNAWKELDCNHQPPFSLEATKLQNELEFLLGAL